MKAYGSPMGGRNVYCRKIYLSSVGWGEARTPTISISRRNRLYRCHRFRCPQVKDHPCLGRTVDVPKRATLYGPLGAKTMLGFVPHPNLSR